MNTHFEKDSLLQRFHLVTGNHQLSQNSIAVRLAVCWLAFKHTWQLKLHKLKHTESLMLEGSQLTVSNSECWPTLSMLGRNQTLLVAECWIWRIEWQADLWFKQKIVGWIKPFFLNVFESKVTIKGDLKTSFPALLSFKGVDALIPFFINIFSDPKHKPNLQVFRVQAFKSAMKTNHLRSHQSHHSQQRITKKTTEKQEAGVFFGLLFFCWFTCEISTSKIHPGSSTARPWKWMVGRMLEV